MNFKTYLGDSVYADIECGMIKLTTENSSEPNNTIFLEPEVFRALMLWEQYVRKAVSPPER